MSETSSGPSVIVASFQSSEVPGCIVRCDKGDGRAAAVLHTDGWTLYRKKALTKAVRIEGPFVVQTSEGPLRCEDGYLAVDARGYPYPIAVDEFALIYEEEMP